MNDQKWLALITLGYIKRNKTTLYLIQDSTITTAIDIRRYIVSVINIANIPLSHQHVRMHTAILKNKVS